MALVAVGAGVVFGLRTTAQAPVGSSPSTSSALGEIGESVSVHVAGWVVDPGVVETQAGSRVADVIGAAGGFRPGASVDAVNLAAPVVDGQQVVVPGPREPGEQVEPNSQDGLVHLNTAEASELEELPGVGPVLADRIVEYRERNGPFEVAEDLLEVPGIGETTLATLRESVVVP